VADRLQLARGFVEHAGDVFGALDRKAREVDVEHPLLVL
jgi:hypothetical protein